MGETPSVAAGGIRSFTLARLPRIVFGSGRLRELPAIVAPFGPRVLVVARAAFMESDRWPDLADELRSTGVDVAVELAPSGEPSPEAVDALVSRHRSRPLDVVVGIGGGSVLDVAKAVAGLLRTGTSVLDHLEGVGPGLPYPGPSVPFVAVPTTAGTGSEATKNAVLSRRGPGGFKRSFRDDRLVAAVALIDPDLLATCPPELVAIDGMDALTQLLEAYVSSGSSPVTDALALSGLEAARDGLLAWHDAALRGGDAPAARARMAYAAMMSGICLANAGLGAVHGLASPLGALFPIAHGAACGAVLAAATRVNIAALVERAPGDRALAKYARAGRALSGRSDLDDTAGRETLVDLLDGWRVRLGIRGLGAFGIAERDVPGIVADSRGSSMRTNPIVLSDDEIASIVGASL